MCPEEGYTQLVSLAFDYCWFCVASPSPSLSLPHSQGLTRVGYVSKPPLPEVRAVNCLRGQEEKRKKDEAKATALWRRLRREAHES